MPGVIGSLPSHPTHGECGPILVHQGAESALGARPDPAEATRRAGDRIGRRVPVRAGSDERLGAIPVPAPPRRATEAARTTADHSAPVRSPTGTRPGRAMAADRVGR